MSWGEAATYITWIFLVYKAFKDPFYGILGYYWLTLMRPQDIWYYTSLVGTRLSFIIAIVAIFSATFHWLRGDADKSSEVPKQNIFYFIFWIGIILSYVNSYSQEVSWRNFLLLTKMVFFYYISGYWVRNKKQFYMLSWMVVCSIGYLSYFANDRYFFQGFFLPIQGPGNSEAACRDNNIFGMVFVVGIPFCYFLAQLAKKMIIKTGLFVVLITMLHSIILTMSRGAFLGMLFSCGESLMRTKRKWVAIVIGLAGYILFMSLWGGGSRERMGTIFASDEERDASAQSRIVAWKWGWKVIKSHPITGIGLDMFEKYSSMHSEEVEGTSGLVAHNAYIQMTAEAGIFAGAGLVLLILYSWFDMTRIKRMSKKGLINDEAGIYASMIRSSFSGYIVSSMFLSLDTFEPLYFMILMAVLLRKLVMKGEFAVTRAVA